MDAVFTINPDASVSGRIGDATVINGRVVYDRSWFGGSCIGARIT